MIKRPDPVDVMVGKRIRVLRLERKISQETLAHKMGVSYQQLQKYEKGHNRMGASRLQRVADAFGVSIPELFEGVVQVGKLPTELQSLYEMTDTVGASRLLRAYCSMKDPGLRTALINLAEAMVNGELT
jgi:transcriptional regulator with XRE-family HTH domain